MTRRPGTRSAADRGSEAIEAAIGVPAFLLLVGLILMAGRIAIANQAVDAAAADAARAASIARSQTQAHTDGDSAAAATLAAQHLTCLTRQVTVDTSQFAAPVGTPAQVHVTVTCVVALADLTIPGISGTRTVTATMTSPLDTYRDRR